MVECRVYVGGKWVEEEFGCVKRSEEGGFYSVDEGLGDGVVIIGIWGYEVVEVGDRVGEMMGEGMVGWYIE